MKILELVEKGGNAFERHVNQISDACDKSDFKRMRKSCKSLEKVATNYLKKANNCNALDADEIDLKPLFIDGLISLIRAAQEGQKFATLQIESHNQLDTFVKCFDETTENWDGLRGRLECR